MTWLRTAFFRGFCLILCLIADVVGVFGWWNPPPSWIPPGHHRRRHCHGTGSAWCDTAIFLEHLGDFAMLILQSRLKNHVFGVNPQMNLWSSWFTKWIPLCTFYYYLFYFLYSAFCLGCTGFGMDNFKWNGQNIYQDSWSVCKIEDCKLHKVWLSSLADYPQSYEGCTKSQGHTLIMNWL